MMAPPVVTVQTLLMFALYKVENWKQVMGLWNFLNQPFICTRLQPLEGGIIFRE